ncbi:GAF domain-containing protein [Trueperella sp. LYQ143]|uniref:sensor histidine kinase n=1 Tax=unclassified Trueperella TaxID=2630174 RepID=UPI0039835ADB
MRYAPPEDVFHHALRISGTLDRVAALQELIRAGCHITGARFGAVNVLDSHGETIEFIQYGARENEPAVIPHPRITADAFTGLPHDSWLIHNSFDIRELPDGHPTLRNMLGISIIVNEQVWGRLYLCDKPTDFSSTDGEHVEFLVAAAAIAVVNSQRYADAENRARWLTASQMIMSSLLEGSDEDEALETIAHQMRLASRSDVAIIILPSIQQTWISEIVDADDPAESHALIGLAFPPEGRARTVMREQSGVVVDSMQRLRTVRVTALRRFGPALYTPMVSHGVGRGIILLLRYPGRREFNLHDLSMAENVAKQATIAIELAEARHAQEVAAELDERARISRDLHDLAIQQLFASGMHITAVREEMDKRQLGPEITDALDDAISAIDDSVKQIRHIVHSLRDGGSSATLVSRLQHETSVARQALGFAPSLVVRYNGATLSAPDDHLIDDAVGSDIADDVVAVVREGLSNAARHAKAASAFVDLAVCSHDVIIRVIDDGAGIAHTRERRSGLSNLAARARRHHGTFTIGVRDDGRSGTMLEWRVPLQ